MSRRKGLENLAALGLTNPSRNLADVQPVFRAIEAIAARHEACSRRYSMSVRKASERTSNEHSIEILFLFAPSSQRLQPPPIPSPFTLLIRAGLARPTIAGKCSVARLSLHPVVG